MPDYDDIDAAQAALAQHGQESEGAYPSGDLGYGEGDSATWLVEDPPENPFEEPPPPLDSGALAPATAEAKAERPSLVDFLKGHLLTTDDLESIPEPVSIIGDDFLFLDTINWLIGKPGHGKSFVALDLAGCVGTGSRWHGRDVVQGRTLYIAAEGVRGVRQRVRSWEHAHGTKMAGVDFLPFPVQSTNGSHWDALVQTAADNAYVLIIVDTQARVTVGVEENSNKEMGTFVHQAERLRTAGGACTLLVHHVASGSERGRGATTLDGALTTIMRADRDGTLVTLSCQKNKDAPEWEPIEFTITSHGASAVLVATRKIGMDLIRSVTPDAMRTAGKWWESYRSEWQTSKAIQEATATTHSTLGRHRGELLRFGYAQSSGDRMYRYRLTGDPSVPPGDRVAEPEPVPPAPPEPLF